MRFPYLIFGMIALLAPAFAQGIVKGPKQAARQAAKAAKQGKQPPLPKMIPNPQIERLRKMSPEEREKALASLAPERRLQIEQRLDNLDNRLGRLNDQQRQEFDQRVETFENLRPVRQQAVRMELQYLRSLRPVDRRAELMSDDFAQKFSLEEQKLIREVITGRPQ